MEFSPSQWQCKPDESKCFQYLLPKHRPQDADDDYLTPIQAPEHAISIAYNLGGWPDAASNGCIYLSDTADAVKHVALTDTGRRHPPPPEVPPKRLETLTNVGTWQTASPPAAARLQLPHFIIAMDDPSQAGIESQNSFEEYANLYPWETPATDSESETSDSSGFCIEDY